MASVNRPCPRCGAHMRSYPRKRGEKGTPSCSNCAYPEETGLVEFRCPEDHTHRFEVHGFTLYRRYIQLIRVHNWRMEIAACPGLPLRPNGRVDYYSMKKPDEGELDLIKTAIRLARRQVAARRVLDAQDRLLALIAMAGGNQHALRSRL